jgi:hypothetical protein
MSFPRPLHLALSALLAAALIVAGSAGVAAAAAPAGSPAVGVSLSRTSTSVGIGDSFSFTSTITNRGAAPVSGLVAHLNVLSFTHGVYVDPEDWSSNRTRYLNPIPPGQSSTVSWNVKAVNGGDFGIYVAALGTPAAGTPPTEPTVSPALVAHVTEQRNVNPQGVLPLALGIPAVLAAAMAALRLRLRRRA